MSVETYETQPQIADVNDYEKVIEKCGSNDEMAMETDSKNIPSSSSELEEASQTLIVLDDMKFAIKIDSLQTSDSVNIIVESHDTDANPVPYALKNEDPNDIQCDVDIKSISKEFKENSPMKKKSESKSNNFSEAYPKLKLTDSYRINSNETRNIASSTVSLHEECENKEALKKSLFSKSAENICNIELNNAISNSSSINSLNGPRDIDSDKILADFDLQKSKVTLPLKIESESHPNLDVRYPRSHKEILTQDLGTIVKNVHGIFSSMSGSLKNAYNISQRTATQNKQMNINKLLVSSSLKNTATGKIMNDIFETNETNADESNANFKTKEIVIENGTESYASSNSVNDTNSVVINNCKVPDTNESTEEVAKHDMYRLQMDSMERSLSEQRIEMAALKEKNKQQADVLAEKDHFCKDLESKMDLLRKRTEQAEREKDNAVMRYAVSERSVIEARNLAASAQRAEKTATAEVELLNGKIRSAQAERQRICQLYDDKCHELVTAERELAKTKEELKEYEGRLKWTQSKLRLEMDAYKEASERAEALAQSVSELEANKEAAVAGAADLVKTKQLESELKEARASLILCRHENEELAQRLTTTTQHLEACRRELSETSTALAEHREQVEKLRTQNVQLEEEACELAALRAGAALADTLAAQLQRETERATQAEEERSRERARAETCARREAAALEHAARLTTQHVGERALFQDSEAKSRALAADNASLRERVSSLELESTGLHTTLAEETARRRKECQLLARKVAELTEELAQATQRLDWEKGENAVLKKKHASAVKELNRELQRALKRCEQLEAKSAHSEMPDAASTRTGSISSLSSCEGNATQPMEKLTNGHSDVPEIQVREPDRQTLIERIVQLQRASARRAERCDFLEEHNRQLTGELRRKARVLRQLLCAQPDGALAAQPRIDNKMEMARLGGGAMAAVFGGDPEGMTPELSLEMNRKLQAVLEDTLLKNITLKENMDTLGAEIARLKAQKTTTQDTK